MKTTVIDVDFSEVYNLPETNLEMFFNVCDIGLDIMLSELKDNYDLFHRDFTRLNKEDQDKICRYYIKLKEVYLYFEYYERLPDIIKILEILKEFK